MSSKSYKILNKLAGLSLYLSKDNKSVLGEYTEGDDNRENVSIAYYPFKSFCQCIHIILVDHRAHTRRQRDGAYQINGNWTLPWI